MEERDIDVTVDGKMQQVKYIHKHCCEIPVRCNNGTGSVVPLRWAKEERLKQH
jgi:hypothetical protein